MINVVRKAMRAGSLCLEVLMGILLGLLRGASSDLALQKRLFYSAISAPGGGEVRLNEPLLLVQLDGHALVPSGFLDPVP